MAIVFGVVFVAARMAEALFTLFVPQLLAQEGPLLLLSGAATIGMQANVIAFCIWFYGVYGNLRVLGVTSLRHSQGMAPGSLFIPIVSFYLPYVIANEIWRGSRPHSAEYETWSPVNIWWACRMVTLFGAIIVSLLGSLLTQDVRQSSLISYGIVFIAAPLNGVLEIVVIRGIQRRQRRRLEEMA